MTDVRRELPEASEWRITRCYCIGCRWNNQKDSDILSLRVRHDDLLESPMVEFTISRRSTCVNLARVTPRQSANILLGSQTCRRREVPDSGGPRSVNRTPASACPA